jgi:hypothetical protein
MMRTRSAKLCILAILGVAALSTPARPKAAFCPDVREPRAFLKNLCDYIALEKRDNRVMFRGAYYMRTLVAGYEILGERRYLDLAVAYADKLLERQMPTGYWPTGYGAIFLADTASAIGLFIALDRHVDELRRLKYLEAVRRHVTAIEADGFINASGGLGAGWRRLEGGIASDKATREYTVGSAVCGGEVFTWMYYKTGLKKYRQIAARALRWVLGTMAGDGRIPYIFEAEGTDLARTGDQKNDYLLWERIPYDTAAYVGEGLAAFDAHCGDRGLRDEVRRKIAPHIDWLLRTQNENGTWGIMDSHDQKRSPLLVNFLSWYYNRVERDGRIVRAIRKYCRYLLVPENAKAYGLLNWGARQGPPVRGEEESNDVLTAMIGPAIAEMISPGVMTRW